MQDVKRSRSPIFKRSWQMVSFFKLLWSFFWHADEWLANMEDFRKWEREAEEDRMLHESLSGRPKVRSMWD